MQPSGKVVIAGGTGFLGRSLARRLVDAGCDVVLLSRHAPGPGEVPGCRHVTWDARSRGEWCTELNGASALVNLAGRTVDCIKTPEHRDQILRSRVESTAVLGRAVRTIDEPPPVWVQMSTAHIHGDPPTLVCDESSAIGEGLAPLVGRAWEETFADAALPEMRGVVLRTSFVLGRGGGAFPQLRRLARFGLGGRAGHGRQGISWLHEADMNSIFLRAFTDERMRGVYMTTAPNPVSNAVFMRELRKAIGMPIGLPAPAWLVRLGARFVMRSDPELVLLGRYCVPTRLLESGFEFEFADVGAAFADLCRRS